MNDLIKISKAFDSAKKAIGFVYNASQAQKIYLLAYVDDDRLRYDVFASSEMRKCLGLMIKRWLDGKNIPYEFKAFSGRWEMTVEKKEKLVILMGDGNGS